MMIFTLAGINIVLLMIQSACVEVNAISAGQCVFGPGCLLPCRCKTDGEACNSMTGLCPSGCADGNGTDIGTQFPWTGPGCQIGNYAYQSGGKFVNGIVACDSSAVESQFIDLSQELFIFNVTIFYQATTNVDIKINGVDDSRDGNSSPVCVQLDPPVGYLPLSSINKVTCQGTGALKRRGVSLLSQMTIGLCQVVVMAGKPITGNPDCDLCDDATYCPVVGCSSCNIGMPPYCSTCQSGKYGFNCQKNCSVNCIDEQCNERNGNCLCTGWFGGSTCDIPIPLIQFDAESNGSITLTKTNDGSTVTVSWMSVPVTSVDNYYYVIQYQNSSSTYELEKIQQSASGVSQLSYNVTGLRYNTAYTFSIIPFRSAGSMVPQNGGPSNSVSQLTDCGAPTSPFIDEVKPSNNGQSITVVWKAPTDLGCNSIVYYELTITQTKALNDSSVLSWTERFADSPGTIEGHFDDLTTCEVSLLAANDGNFTSSPSTRPVYANGEPVTLTDFGALKAGLGAGLSIGLVVLIVLGLVLFWYLRIRKNPDWRRSLVIKTRHPRSATDENLFAVGNTVPKNDSTTQRVATDYPKEPPPAAPTNGGPAPVKVKPKVAPRPTKASPRPTFLGNLRHSLPPPYEVPDEAEECYGNSVVVPTTEFFNYVQRGKGNGRFAKEFTEFPPGQLSPWEAAVIPINLKKNHIDKRPYDFNRVQLTPLDGVPNSDYINASRIPGFGTDSRGYIATVGPRGETIADFWRMVWQYNANTIAMIVNLTEHGKVKCERYWPENVHESQKYGAMKVETLSVEQRTDYAVRTFRLTNNKSSQSRIINQCHMQTWTDVEGPDNPLPMVEFYQRMHLLDNFNTGPLIVHCSAGIGRTAVVIAFDFLLKQAIATETVDVRACVLELRKQRIDMVQKENQYTFLHDWLALELSKGDTAIPASKFASDFKALYSNDPNGASTSESESLSYQQFQVAQGLLQYSVPQLSVAATDSRNAVKNRNPRVVPVEKRRVILTSMSRKGNDYINAVFVNGYQVANQYILTQTPLPTTLDDFSRLVFEQNCTTIVAIDTMDDELTPAYWPETGSKTYESFNVKLIKTGQKLQNLTTRDLKISPLSSNKSSGFTIRQIHVGHMLGTNDLVHSELLLQVVSLIDEWTRERPNGRILVHCRDGEKDCGLLCVALHALERLRLDETVDVFSSLLHVRQSRPRVVDDFGDYQFVHDLILKYMTEHGSYSNFSY